MKETISIFYVKGEHLKLLKELYVSWNDSEFGAPSIDCKKPYGNSDVLEDIIRILGLNHDEHELANIYHNQMDIVLQILVSNLSIQLGPYFKKDYEKWTNTP